MRRLGAPVDKAAPSASLKNRMSPTMAVAANIGMFIVTAAVCFVLVRGFKSFALAGISESEYVLTTTRQVEAGEPLSIENANWKRIGGHPAPGVVVSKSPSASLAGYVATSRIGPGKPIRMALVARMDGPSAAPKQSPEAGYVLTGQDAANILPYVKTGSQIDVVAIVPSGGKDQVDTSASVATVITNAKVTGVMRAPPTRGNHGGSLVIAVTDEQARLLGVLSHFATLDFVLSPNRVGNGDQPVTAWRKIAELGLPFSPNSPAVASSLGAVAEAPARAEPAGKNAEPAEPAGESVAIITPSGVSQAALRN